MNAIGHQSINDAKQSTSRRNLIIAIALITLGLILISKSFSIAQNKGDFTVPLSDPGKRSKIKVHLNSGSVTVKGTARKDILVTYNSEADHDDDDDDDMNINVDVNVNNDSNEDDGKKKSTAGLKRISGGTLDLEVTQNDNNVVIKSDSWSNQLDLTVEVPSGADLQVQTYNNGDLMVKNIQGTVELTNYNGEIGAENISGSVIATTYNGEIKVTFDKVTENTPMSFSTYNGDIDLTFPASLKATLKMKTERGDIYTGFDVSLVKSSPVQQKDTKPGTYKLVINEWMKGDVNGGGPEITLKNYNGDIYVRKK
ncbi:MAG TPA: DUF4097 family beta strand repeat-containing protein [Cyclobacteriaceae bacterium]|nr:DUF4097 family beta strand repeat-containing protein [Cyclobacteriaceae bacterium]